MGKKIDMKGLTYGRLTVLKEANRLSGHVRWDVVCECGSKLTVRGVDLRNGSTSSCGCYHLEQASKYTKGISPKERKRLKEERMKVSK